MSCIVIIPARAGSKVIKNKNIQPINGLPLIAYNIRAAFKASKVERVIVSTDGDSIANIAKEHGAEIVKRPEAISGDTASSESALLHALDELEKEKPLPSYTCFAQCTSPLTMPEDFDNILAMIEGGKYDSVFAAARSHAFLWKIDQKGHARGINHDETKQRQMRQNQPPQYQEIGALYVFKTEEFRKHKNRFFGRIGIYEMPASRTLDIDDSKDMEKAAVLLQDYIKS